MANQYFHFKQFTIFQDKCAMKVGADGVTLGAWCDVNEVTTILDVGCGTGLLALMLAQKNSKSRITAIDIDVDCICQATENCKKSSFNKRITTQQVSFQKFTKNTDIKFDLIISNPPYFNSSLKSPLGARNLARHTDTLPHQDLITCSKEILSIRGRLCLILPIKEGEIIIRIAEDNGLFCAQKTLVFPNSQKQAKRMLLEFQFKKCNTILSDLVIEKERGVYTEDYAQLVEDYYLGL